MAVLTLAARDAGEGRERRSRRASTLRGGRREPRFTGAEALLSGVRGDAPGPTREMAQEMARRGPGHRTPLAFPLRTPPAVREPCLQHTVGASRRQGQRIGRVSPVPLWTSLWTRPGQPVWNRLSARD